MDPIQVSILIFFGIIFYIISIDKNVEDYLVLIFKLIKLNIEKIFWMIRLHPKNPITNFTKNREYYKIAKELEKEFNKTND